MVGVAKEGLNLLCDRGGERWGHESFDGCAAIPIEFSRRVEHR